VIVRLATAILSKKATIQYEDVVTQIIYIVMETLLKKYILGI